MTLLTFS